MHSLGSIQDWGISAQPKVLTAGFNVQRCSSLIFKVLNYQRSFSCGSAQNCNRDLCLPTLVERGPTSQSSCLLPGTPLGWAVTPESAGPQDVRTSEQGKEKAWLIQPFIGFPAESPKVSAYSRQLASATP